MKNYTPLLFFAVLSITTYGQDLFTISLEKFSIKRDSIPFKVSEVIDGRKDKKIIGIIQLGLSNRKDFAVFEKPGLQEIEDLMGRSGLISKENGLVMRVSKLYISEITQTWKETAKAELSVDFFILQQNDYYYLTSIYTTAEPNGVDVTREHASNIVTVLKKSLTQFTSRMSKIDQAESFTREELMDPTYGFRNVSTMPIVQATQYKDGYYTTFDEFVNNEPSLDIQCKIKLGANPKIKCGDKEESTGIYGFAKDNQLYVLFHQHFYLLEKNKNGFFFQGPRETSSRAMGDLAKGWVTAGALGGGLGFSSHQYNAFYSIDLSSGSIKNATGL